MENADLLRRAGAALGARDIVASRFDDHLVLRLRGGTHSITIPDYFRKNAAGGYVREEVRVVDGVLQNVAQPGPG